MLRRWRELLSERLDEAAAALAAVPGVDGLVVGGSVGRGEPWPLSDIDLLPIRSVEAAAEVERRRAGLVDRWAASGRAQSLDVGWLAFTREEAERAVSDNASAAERMADRRWFHGLDKMYGGRGTHDPLGLADALARWATAVRFAPEVVEARAFEWRRQALHARELAVTASSGGDWREATIRLRESASALRMVLVERWGERLGSMGREWTRFERMADSHGAAPLARRIAFAAAAMPEGAARALESAPGWLIERIELAYAARQEVGEVVTADESARDQVAAFRTLVVRHRPDTEGAWLALPDPHLESRLAELTSLLEEICGPYTAPSTTG